MGMSASQARYLGLIARQNDLEYQGQQINQERTVLSQQVTDLYNTLQNMNVPTPPSTSDFTKVVYSGSDGATPFTLGNIIPTGDSYTVDFNYKKTGHYLDKAGSAIVEGVAANVELSQVNLADFQEEIEAAKTAKTYSVPSEKVTDGEPVDDGTWMMCKVGTNPSGNATYYVIDGGEFVELTNENKNKYTGQTRYEMRQAHTVEGESGSTSNYAVDDYIFGEQEPAAGSKVTQEAIKGVTRDIIISKGLYAIKGGSAALITEVNFNNFFSVDSHGVCTPKGGITLGKEGSGTLYPNADSNIDGAYKVGGNLCYTFDDAVKCGAMSSDSAANYLEAIRDAFPEQAGKTDAELKANYRVYFTKSDSQTLIPHFVTTDSLTNNMTDVNNNKYVDTYDYLANGTYTSAQSKAGCKLTFDTSGRITKIEMPTKYDKEGVPTAYKTLHLEAATETDENAYQDAYNKYEYNKYLYDKEQQEINAKTEVIQQEDKKLELKLQRLDNERTQITTEIEAVEKVINDNIEASYKTFSG